MPRGGASGTEQVSRLTDQINTAFERHLPERRLFLKSDHETRFIRLRPATQALALGGVATVVSWSLVVTAILLADTIGSGNVRDQAQREQALYEARLNEMAEERDSSAQEARNAQERFNIALSRVSEMQSLLLESEDRRAELETGLDVVQNTLRRVMNERDAALAEVDSLEVALDEESDSAGSTDVRLSEAQQTLAFVSDALSRVAEERDDFAMRHAQSKLQSDHIAMENRLMEDRNERIFTQLEEAVQVSMEPLEKVFRDAGLETDRILREVRNGRTADAGALQPVSFSTKGDLDDEALRASNIMDGLDEINTYRMAADQVPFAEPIQSGGVRLTSRFGTRNDPKTGARRMHEGVDWAGARGTPILATSDGTVVHAGSKGGYGRSIKIRHAFGIETFYAHMHRLHVQEGQTVSRGDHIGDMGTTGRSTGVHLHYEVRLDGQAINPMPYVEAARDVF